MDQGIDFVSEKDRIDSITALINSRGWIGFFVPELQQARNAALALLVNPTQARRDEMPDDFLRGRIYVLEELLARGPAVVAEWNHNHALTAAEEDYEQALQERAELGSIAPLPMR